MGLIRRAPSHQRQMTLVPQLRCRLNTRPASSGADALPWGYVLSYACIRHASFVSHFVHHAGTSQLSLSPKVDLKVSKEDFCCRWAWRCRATIASSQGHAIARPVREPEWHSVAQDILQGNLKLHVLDNTFHVLLTSPAHPTAPGQSGRISTLASDRWGSCAPPLPRAVSGSSEAGAWRRWHKMSKRVDSDAQVAVFVYLDEDGTGTLDVMV